METKKLGKTNLDLTKIGFGASGFGNLYREISTRQSCAALDKIWDVGCRYFDVAPHYGAGLAERRLGLSLHKYNRDDYILSTKVGRILHPRHEQGVQMPNDFPNEAPFNRHYDYSYSGVMRSFEDSCQRLGTNRIDILLMHDIGSYTHGDQHNKQFKIAMDGGYKAMDELRSQGLVTAIGIGCNEHDVLKEAMPHTDFDCFMLAGRYTLLNQTADDGFLDECAKKNISIILAGVFNSGILASGPKTGSYYDYAPASDEIIAKVQRIYQVCEKHNVDPIAAAIQFPFRHKAITSVMLNAMKEHHLESNLKGITATIPHEFWNEIDTLTHL
ncbi:aldo/keto reductase [Photobacterium sp. GB-36]|uniref:aldo/keto reductase n=1 Tax=Photobacterium sp. GB-36 TaxID=2022108 RepID=UPI000D15C357|nr:aldo/keto reductase [Photobacterium sp. GB-36]PSV48049.1 aldo/keto reductase [Photobacterium sp. GB-36]